MQRKALKQVRPTHPWSPDASLTSFKLGKVTQWTNEKVRYLPTNSLFNPLLAGCDGMPHADAQVFSGEKTQLSSEFTQFERDIDIKKNGIERLHAVSEPFFNQISKRKTTADPLPPSGSGKDKILYTEALGLVMIDYGDAVVGGFGEPESQICMRGPLSGAYPSQVMGWPSTEGRGVGWQVSRRSLQTGWGTGTWPILVRQNTSRPRRHLVHG